MEQNEHLESSTKLKYLAEIIKADMNGSKAAGTDFRHWAKWLKITTIVLSALITIILGLTFNSEAELNGVPVVNLVKNIAVILSALLTAVNTWDAFANYQIRSTQEFSIIQKLSLLYKDISLHLIQKENCKITDFESFKSRYDVIHEEYSQERNTSKDEGKKENSTEPST
ncbi:hypothetical protein R70723_06815 [Paenibacillus sp. FSL R7-0273]|uniref:SLATT domain-containing protein n=1 Tax=Paenibacillus sp. FSL R7-0273 TaxID=1536772 RepID=UPI0004F6BDB6|nr:SLATT domain-containing protein [Paenibacillus sp. FSL R7-0273]AIQ45636.1 hypothetical protein R70723_06815 [Paenibacillus sp. FSL R7-0273]OMF95157.1 hypothetical protein BK144_06370 [Paenibacillus sp. FSL R7-0273]